MEGSRYDADALLRAMRADYEHPWPYLLLDAIEQRRPAEHPLSPKETRALEAASRGLELQMIADTYCVGVETVKTQLKAARVDPVMGFRKVVVIPPSLVWTARTMKRRVICLPTSCCARFPGGSLGGRGATCRYATTTGRRCDLS